MYCTVQNVIDLLPENVTVGDTNIGTPVPGKTSKRDKLTPTEITQFIKLAQQEVDSRLRPMYICPLRRIKIHETGLLNNVSAGNNVTLSVQDSGAFAVGQLVRVQSDYSYEEATVSSIPNLD